MRALLTTVSPNSSQASSRSSLFWASQTHSLRPYATRASCALPWKQQECQVGTTQTHIVAVQHVALQEQRPRLILVDLLPFLVEFLHVGRFQSAAHSEGVNSHAAGPETGQNLKL